MKGDCADNLVKILISKLKERDIDVDSFRVQKVLFKVKMELSENHPFWNSLPYYWYHLGSVSNVVDETVSRYINGDFDESYLKASKIIDNIIADEDYYFGGIERDIYENFAPFKAMSVFRFKIYKIADSHESVDFDLDELINSFNTII